MIRPCTGVVTQGFSSAHPAVDIADDRGTPIRAPRAGKVTIAGWLGDCGIGVQIGDPAGNADRLCHNGSLAVALGQTVKEGQIVAYMGNTGKVIGIDGGDGTHCHWVCWVNGVRVNGLSLISGGGSPPPSSGGKMATDSEIKLVFNKLLFRNPDPGAYKTYRKLERWAVFADVAKSQERKNREADIVSWKKAAGTVSGLKAQIAKLTKQLQDQPGGVDRAAVIDDVFNQMRKQVK